MRCPERKIERIGKETKFRSQINLWISTYQEKAINYFPFDNENNFRTEQKDLKIRHTNKVSKFEVTWTTFLFNWLQITMVYQNFQNLEIWIWKRISSVRRNWTVVVFSNRQIIAFDRYSFMKLKTFTDNNFSITKAQKIDHTINSKKHVLWPFNTIFWFFKSNVLLALTASLTALKAYVLCNTNHDIMTRQL